MSKLCTAPLWILKTPHCEGCGEVLRGSDGGLLVCEHTGRSSVTRSGVTHMIHGILAGLTAKILAVIRYHVDDWFS